MIPFVFWPFLNIPCHIASRFCEKHVSYWQKREQSIKKNHDEKKENVKMPGKTRTVVSLKNDTTLGTEHAYIIRHERRERNESRRSKNRVKD